ncbi:MAG: chlorohydrolase [Actinobacteria bacterium 69-20]|jgi:5-methylthioadenosine/S-adenosylhomocysteine deaminase|nr:amidohydrolase [Actinomycetota bacterium]OJV27950.1 MAG: chlorohydrolase [Actinobacteria bacterium 69-20]
MIVIENATVLTLNDADDVHFGGHVVLVDNRILSVGDGPFAGPVPASADRIDATGMIVMPGLVDLHYHTAVGKGLYDHVALRESLERFWYPSIRALDADLAYGFALHGYADSLLAGVTTVNDMYRRLPDLARAADAAGIRAVLSNDVALAQHRLDQLSDVKEAFESCHGSGDGRIEVFVGIEWLPLASPELLQEAAELARALDTGVHVHLNESLDEVETVRRRFGARPTELAFHAGLLGPKTVAAHCVWLSDHEIDLMRQTATSISYNPISNAKLGNGIARVPDMIAAGINVGLGHDAAESSNTHDLFEIMKFASLIQRADRQNSMLIPADQVVRMATQNGGRALGHESGQLSPGQLADVIILHTERAMFTPLLPGDKRHVYSHLAYAANSSIVDTTIVDGRILVRGGALVEHDYQELRQRANEGLKILMKRIDLC